MPSKDDERCVLAFVVSCFVRGVDGETADKANIKREREKCLALCSEQTALLFAGCEMTLAGGEAGWVAMLGKPGVHVS